MGRPFVMVTAEEHTAQVPGEVRNKIEQDFKSKHGRTNCLVATPTLEMGVNIGALDMALMRNVPPRPSNYWQRAGRAGREERMAVVVTYCRRSNHDRYFFDDPLRLLGGAIEAPTFNLRNPLMVAKHIRSAILSELLLRSEEPGDAGRAGPGRPERPVPDLHPGLPAGRGQPLPGDADQHGPAQGTCWTRSRASWRIGWSPSSPSTGPRRPPNWPTATAIERIIDETADALDAVIKRLHRRLTWARATRSDLHKKKDAGLIEREEEQLLRRCDEFINVDRHAATGRPTR